MMAWLTAVLVAGAVYLAWPADGLSRLAPRAGPVLPGWVAPLPGAMASRTRWWLAAAGGVGLAAYGWGTLPWLVALAPVVVVGGWLALGRMERGATRRDRARSKADLPYALDLIRLGLSAGQPLRTAVATAAGVMDGTVGATLERLGRGVSVGLSDAQAWTALADDPIWGDVARDIARAADWGASLIDILTYHAGALRRQVAADRLGAAKAVGVKSVAPLGLCYLPAFVCLGVVPVVVGGVLAVFH